MYSTSICLLNSCSSFIFISGSISLVFAMLFFVIPGLLSLPRWFLFRRLLRIRFVFTSSWCIWFLFCLFVWRILASTCWASSLLISANFPSLTYCSVHSCVVQCFGIEAICPVIVYFDIHFLIVYCVRVISFIRECCWLTIASFVLIGQLMTPLLGIILRICWTYWCSDVSSFSLSIGIFSSSLLYSLWYMELSFSMHSSISVVRFLKDVVTSLVLVLLLWNGISLS